MGLGKTVQSISLLAHLAERHNIWGPFLVIAPASTLHNWQQEFSKFAPDLKVLPYWGNVNDRKILRKFWNPKKLYARNSPFHVLITSYQLIVTDEKYFQRIKWQYMVLDEAQAIKSSTSTRWKILLGFNCRNRVLLTGTPIQNTMQELWALLHFIMPSLFDSHDEFSEWFSKDIESHAENKGTLNEHQLSRLHMILKPFMLRRVKKDVENELSDKVEIEISCELSTRQKRMYNGIKAKIPISELLEKSGSQEIDTLMNIVMQLRKVT
jgi:DNA helicase INO80